MEVVYSLNEQQVNELWTLYQQEWWSEKRSLEETIACTRGSSICIGLIDNNKLIGFARVLTDYIFKAMIYDVIISKDMRGRGLGDKLLQLIKNHPSLSSVNSFELYCIPEMISFYKKHGFSDDVGDIVLMRCALE